MADSYPDAPSRRMPYDDDGTVVFGRRSVGGAYVEATAGEKEEFNAEDNASPGVVFETLTANDTARAVAIFPEEREFDGMFQAWEGGTGGPTIVDSSGNTTNGVDGSWTQRDSGFPSYTSSYPTNYRNNIKTYTVSNVRGLRWDIYGGGSGGPKFRICAHIYGTISAGETPDRLLFLDAENSDVEFTKPLDYGDEPRGQSQDYNIKIKNNSGSLTANSVQLTAEDFYLGSASWYTFSDDGGMSFSATLNIGNLGAGATQAIIVRQDIPGAETVGLHAARIKANTASWS